MKAKEIRVLQSGELEKTLAAKRKELFDLYFKIGADHKQMIKSRTVKREIARLLTIKKTRT